MKEIVIVFSVERVPAVYVCFVRNDFVPRSGVTISDQDQ